MIYRWFFPLAVTLMLLFTALPVSAEELQIRDISVGDGAVAEPGALAVVHYTGWLMDGSKFDSSRDRGDPFRFTIGGRQVISGWDQGVVGMRVGGERELIIPPELAYGPQGAGGVIPPNATLRFVITLEGLEPAKFHNINNQQLGELRAQGVKIVDIRRPEEWRKTGIIKDSKLLTFFTKGGQVNPLFMPEFSGWVNPDEPVILICRTGNRTLAVSRYLSERLGFSQVYNVSEGITQWKKAGLPTVPCNC